MANDYYFDDDNVVGVAPYFKMTGSIMLEIQTDYGVLPIEFLGENFTLESGYDHSEEYDQYTPAIMTCDSAHEDEGFVITLKISSHDDIQVLHVREVGSESNLSFTTTHKELILSSYAFKM